MAILPRPDEFPEWARVPSVDPVVGGDNIVEPSEAKKDIGWERNEKPPAQYQNWLHNKADEWIKYFESIIQDGNILGLVPGLSGLVLSNNITDPDHDLDIAAGHFRDSDNTGIWKIASALTKKIDETFAVGTDAGLLAEAAFPAANDTWYHIFGAVNPTTGATAIIGDTDASGANIITDTNAIAAGLTKFRKIGHVYYTSDAIRYFVVNGSYVKWNSAATSVGISLSGAYSNHDTLVPPGLRVMAHVALEFGGGGAITTAHVKTPDLDGSAIFASGNTNDGDNGGSVTFLTDTSSQLAFSRANTTGANSLERVGWWYPSSFYE